MTPDEYFSEIEIPDGWEYLGINNVKDGERIISYGRVYRLDKNTKMRLFFQPAPIERGGLVKRIPGEYNLLIYHQSAADVNDYIRGHYGN